MVMKNVFIYSLDEIQYEIWVFPGIVILMSLLSTYSVIYRDLFNLRIHKKAFVPITLAPYSKSYLVIAILISAIIESLIYGSIAMIILSFFLPEVLPWSVWFYIFITFWESGLNFFDSCRKNLHFSFFNNNIVFLYHFWNWDIS